MELKSKKAKKKGMYRRNRKPIKKSKNGKAN